MKTKIRFGVSRKVSKKIETKNDKTEIDGVWEDKDFHKKAIEKIKELYPEWNINGYCEDK